MEIRGKLVSVSVGAAAGGGGISKNPECLKTAKCGTRGKFMCTLLRLLKQTRGPLILLVFRRPGSWAAATGEFSLVRAPSAVMVTSSNVLSGQKGPVLLPFSGKLIPFPGCFT